MRDAPTDGLHGPKGHFFFLMLVQNYITPRRNSIVQQWNYITPRGNYITPRGNCIVQQWREPC